MKPGAIITGALKRAGLGIVTAVTGLTVFETFAQGDPVSGGARPNREAHIADLVPMLPVHVWSNHRHRMGLTFITHAGKLAYAELIQETSREPDLPGYWIEEWKMTEARRLFPDALKSFEFCDPTVISGITYYRVQPCSGLVPP